MCVTHGRFAGAAALAEDLGMVRSDRLYTGLSLTHGNAQLITMGGAMALGAPLVISRQFTKSRLWEILARYRCTVFNLLGGMTSAIFAEPPGDLDRANDVRLVVSAGMPPPLWRRFEERFGLKVLEFFATAEGGLLVNPPGVGPLGSIGKPPARTICAILDEADRPCPPLVQGEICFKEADGSVTPVRYLDNEAASAAKTRGGWFRSGDIGYRDEAGWFYFSHRAGRSVRRNGDFVDVAAMETFIATLPEVDDVYVYGIRTDATAPGERDVVAAVVPVAGAGDPATVMAACLETLGSLGAPDFIQAVAAIPKTASEKPQERHLVEMINEQQCTIHSKKGPATIRAFEGREDHEGIQNKDIVAVRGGAGGIDGRTDTGTNRAIQPDTV
ncbi:MAG TPA: AMP-binding protein [Sphingomicrobium sp.]